jgi:exosortase A-associated hydrolase 1/exosortase A-associated hydrolase 2
LQLDPLTPYEATARFEPAPGGPRFVLTHRPLRGPERGTVILAPPFAEEMNKSRRMFAQTARALSADGWRVVQIDLYGCGDSAGDFGTATWQHWVADLERAIGTHHADGQLWLWGVRAGAVLLSPLLEAQPAANLLLWQPAHDGAVVLNQFLRLRASGALFNGNGSVDRNHLRQQLARGESVEVAGYLLTPLVANHLADARLALPPQFRGRVLWFDVAGDAAESVSPAAQRMVETWRAAGHTVECETVVGPQFWQTVEIAEAPALIERTRSAIARSRGPADAAPSGPVCAEHSPASPQQPYREKVAWIDCGGERMLGVVCEPAGARPSEQGVLIAVGGPQYRVGSHRQFVRIARALARAGYISLRFDYRGMGDSEGAVRTFEDIEQDLDAAIDLLCAQPGIRSVAILALCDAASAALMFCTANPRVSGLMLLNPWVRSEATLATTHLRHYYGQRLLEREFWIRLLRAQFDWRSSLRGLYDSVRRAARRSRTDDRQTFQAKMADGWCRFRGPISLMLSGRDLTAKEFLEHVTSDSRWQGLLARPNVGRVELADADHTFSISQWHEWLEEQTTRWLGSTTPAGVVSDARPAGRGAVATSRGEPAVGGSR